MRLGILDVPLVPLGVQSVRVQCAVGAGLVLDLVLVGGGRWWSVVVGGGQW